MAFGEVLRPIIAGGRLRPRAEPVIMPCTGIIARPTNPASRVRTAKAGFSRFRREESRSSPAPALGVGRASAIGFAA